MDSFLRVLLLSATCCALLFVIACNSSKNALKQDETFELELKKNLEKKYLLVTYAAYNPTSVSPSNRTINQYQAKFSCTKKQLKALKLNLDNDANVVNWSLAKKGDIDIQSGTNQKSSKVGPIRDN